MELRNIRIFCIGSVNWDGIISFSGIKQEFLGGSAANTCIYLKKLFKRYPLNEKIKINLIAAIGNDKNAEKIRESLEQIGISQNYLISCDGASGKTKITLDSAGERRIERYPSVSSQLAEKLKISPFSSQLKNSIIHCNHSFQTLATIAQFNSNLFSVDISGFLPKDNIKTETIKNRFSAEFDQIFPTITLKAVFGNLNEYSNLLFLLRYITEPATFIKASIPQRVSILRKLKKKLNTQILFVKMGKDGAIILNYDDFFVAKPPHGQKILDTTGAGDIFNAGAIFGLLFSFSLVKILKISVHLGTWKCAFLGAQNFPIETSNLLSRILH
ncbi:MAG: hypothetical protein DRO88_01960 [Promethearchaeia archaeon]|nr:MAG: hypothetical protein DRO88_01960 [Candidatus Lokiarchaeia archaeon]